MFRLEGDSIPGSWVIDKFEGIDQGDEIAEWVSNIIEKKVHLIRADKPWRINFPVPSMKRVHGKPKQKFTAATVRLEGDSIPGSWVIDKFEGN